MNAQRDAEGRRLATTITCGLVAILVLASYRATLPQTAGYARSAAPILSIPIRPEYAVAPPLPVLNSTEAISLLNKQREANGIPGALVDEPALSEGCLSWSTVYRMALGQYPHEELPTQPGYTAEGDLAAKLSDLDGVPGSRFTVGRLWGPLFNPWSAAAFHLAALMNPAVTTTWYGASTAAACMGTSGSRAFSVPAFYSFPGNGATDVPIAENTGEYPKSPQQDVGLSDEYYGGPAILLWDEGTSAHLRAATLSSASGTVVPTGIVTPETDALARASIVVPKARFAPNTKYELTATWEGVAGSSVSQTVSFTTAATDLNGEIEAYEKGSAGAQLRGVPTGSITGTLHGHRLRLTAVGIAVGKVVHLAVVQCSRGDCEYQHVPTPWRRTVRLRKTTVLNLPGSLGSQRHILTLHMAGFVDAGHPIPEIRVWGSLPRGG
jgi:hypothetical protein